MIGRMVKRYVDGVLVEYTINGRDCTKDAGVINDARVATIRDKSVIGSDGWRYFISEKLGYVTAGSYPQLLLRIRERCQSNGVETPSEETVQQWCCDNLEIQCTENGQLYDNQYADRKNWPLILRPMRLLAKDGDKGLGDIVARNIPKGDAFKAWFRSTFGRSCGCDSRTNWLNANFPL